MSTTKLALLNLRRLDYVASRLSSTENDVSVLMSTNILQHLNLYRQKIGLNELMSTPVITVNIKTN